MNLLNVRTGQVVGEIIGEELVKTIFGDTYKVEKSEIEWLMARGQAGKLHVLDIKAVGFLQYD